MIYIDCPMKPMILDRHKINIFRVLNKQNTTVRNRIRNPEVHVFIGNNIIDL